MKTLRIFSLLAVATLVSMNSASSFAQTTDSPAWFDRLSLSGDIRVRVQRLLDDTGANLSENIRPRERIRVGLTGQVNEAMSATVRVSTGALGAGGANSANQDLSEFGGRKVVGFDLGYIEYKAAPAWSVHLGKFPNLFFTAAKTEMVWNSHFAFEGIQTRYNPEIGNFKPWLTLVYSHMLDNPGTPSGAPDIAMWGAQVGTQAKLGGLTANAAFSSYNYNNIGAQLRTTQTTGRGGVAADINRGNLNALGNTVSCAPLTGTNAECVYTHDYQLLGAGFDLTYATGFAPVMIYGDFIQNSLVDEGNSAWIVGARLGALKNVGDWFLEFNYRDVQPDAVFGLHGESSFLNGGTDVMGQQVRAVYQLFTNTTLGFTYDSGHKGVDDRMNENYLLDLIAAF
jgi:hypothetical protein